MKRTKSKKLRNNQKKVILISLAFVVLFGGFGIYQYDAHKTSKSYAVGQGAQLCAGNSNLCLNAWGGGPQVKKYSPGVSQNDFQVLTVGSNKQLKYVGPGVFNSACIGDLNNNRDSNIAGLVGNCGSSGVGWGGNFHPGLCALGGTSYYNIHWQGYLAPGGSNSNGTPFLLNAATPWCFKSLPAV